MSVIWQLTAGIGSESKFFNDFLDNIPLQDRVTINIGNLQKIEGKLRKIAERNGT